MKISVEVGTSSHLDLNKYDFSHESAAVLSTEYLFNKSSIFFQLKLFCTNKILNPSGGYFVIIPYFVAKFT